MDKYKHFILSFVICCLAILTFYGVGVPRMTAQLVGFGIAFGIGIAKEVYDKVSGKGCAEWGDLLADLIGAVMPSLFAFGL